MQVDTHLGRVTLGHDQASYLEEKHEKKEEVLLITLETAEILPNISLGKNVIGIKQTICTTTDWRKGAKFNLLLGDDHEKQKHCEEALHE